MKTVKINSLSTYACGISVLLRIWRSHSKTNEAASFKKVLISKPLGVIITYHLIYSTELWFEPPRCISWIFMQTLNSKYCQMVIILLIKNKKLSVINGLVNCSATYVYFTRKLNCKIFKIIDKSKPDTSASIRQKRFWNIMLNINRCQNSNVWIPCACAFWNSSFWKFQKQKTPSENRVWIFFSLWWHE